LRFIYCCKAEREPRLIMSQAHPTRTQTLFHHTQ
jgi:hypothetical protein